VFPAVNPPPAGQFLANKDDIRPQFQSDFSLTTDKTAVFNSQLERHINVAVNATIDVLDTIPIGEVQGFKEPAIPWYSDQVLPFDITLAAANEYGAAASAKLFGVEILNEGYGMSIDDSVSEMQATFVARTISPLQAVGLPTRKGVHSSVLGWNTRCAPRVGHLATIRNRCRFCCCDLS